MKLFSLLLSVVVFFGTLYFFIIKLLKGVKSFDDYIYVSLLVILMIICITGVIINWEILRAKRKGKVVTFISNNYSKRDSA